MLTSHDEIFKMSFTKIILQALIYLDPSGFGALTKDTMYKNNN